MTAASWTQLSWELVRASGFTAYLLVTLSVVLGLLLSMRWRSDRWPRLVTNDLHNFVTLTAMAFGMIHGLLAWLDPFTAFRLNEVLVPLASHYRPLWMALGIVSLYLTAAVILSTWLRPWIGYRLWRALHVATFLVFALTTVHGIGTGSDTATWWGGAVYAVAVATVLGLGSWRLVAPSGRQARTHPEFAALGVLAAAALALWMFAGPLRPGWNKIANDGHGAGARIALAVAQTAAPPGGFVSRFSGYVSTNPVGQHMDVHVNGSLTGGYSGGLTLLMDGVPTVGGALSVDSSQVMLLGGSATYLGAITAIRGTVLTAVVRPQGGGLALKVTMNFHGTSGVTGTVTAAPLAGAPAGGGGRHSRHGAA